MDCGIPYCHTGCPVNNQIPDWNDLVFNKDWEEGVAQPALDQQLPGIHRPHLPGTVRGGLHAQHRRQPGDHQDDRMCHCRPRVGGRLDCAPEPPESKTGKKVAVVGSGPAGMAAAQQLARAGHDVHLYEKHAKPGGLLRYGIPDFKMEKHLIDRRVAQMEAEGVTFHCNVNVGTDMSVDEIETAHDAVVLTGGSEHPRDLPIEGRSLDGVHYAMDFLPQQNRRVGGEELGDIEPILASGKHVLVIGGGDTGSDCIGTSFRQGALSVTQLEIMPMPPDHEDKAMTWPNWPLKLRTSSSQAEGAHRDWSVMTSKLIGEAGRVTRVQCVRVDQQFKPVDGTEFELKADLVLLAMGFVHPVHEGMVTDLALDLDERGNVKADTVAYQTSREKVFAAGDMRRGQSLVVWAIREGRQAAHSVDAWLMGRSDLPR